MKNKESWFAANCFECNVRNTIILCFVVALMVVIGYLIYYFYWDKIEPHWQKDLKLCWVFFLCVHVCFHFVIFFCLFLSFVFCLCMYVCMCLFVFSQKFGIGNIIFFQ